MTKAAIKNKNTHFTRILELNLRKKLQKYYIWNIVLYSADTWTLWKNTSKHDLFFLLGDSPASEFYMTTFRNTLFHLYR